jgi:hypothetical protein
MNSYYVFLKFAKLWALEQQARTAPPQDPADPSPFS